MALVDPVECGGCLNGSTLTDSQQHCCDGVLPQYVTLIM
jgi:hypothetical protein